MLSIKDTINFSMFDTKLNRKCPKNKHLQQTEILDRMLDMEDKQIVERLDSLISELLRLKQDIAEGEPAFPAAAQELVEKRICLICKEKIDEDEQSFRGNHEKHYRQVTRAIARGELTEREAIARGLMAPQSTPGRKRIPLPMDTIKTEVREAESKIKQKRKRQ